MNLLRPRGYVVVFLGTDGSGKTTLINDITPTLNELFANEVYYRHLRPGLVPPISRLLGKTGLQVGPVTDPHASEPSGLLGSIIRWSYYLIDYTVGYYFKVLPTKISKACVWIFDRYYYDYYFDQHRSRIRLPQCFIIIGELLIPKPDIIICLGTSPEIMLERKPELPLAEIERQNHALKSFCVKRKRAIWIDTGTSIEESSSAMEKALFDVMGRTMNKIQ